MKLTVIILSFAACALAMDKENCGDLADYRPETGVSLPGFYVKDSIIGGETDMRFSGGTKLYYKMHGKCVDLGKEFTAEGLVQASKLFEGLDFSKTRTLEYFLGFYFKAMQDVGKGKSGPSLAYLKEDGVSNWFIVVSSPRIEVTNDKSAAHEEYVYQKMECLSVNSLGRFEMGEKKRCAEIMEKHLGYFLKTNKTVK